MRPSCESEVRWPLDALLFRFIGVTYISLAAERWRVIALTNNYSKLDSTFLGIDTRHLPRYPGVTLESELRFLGWESGVVPPSIRGLFDDFVDSSEVGMRWGDSLIDS